MKTRSLVATGMIKRIVVGHGPRNNLNIKYQHEDEAPDNVFVLDTVLMPHVSNVNGHDTMSTPENNWMLQCIFIWK